MVKAVLARDSAYPHDLVRRNLVYILATASGCGDGHRAGARTGWPARSPSYFQNSVSKFGPLNFCPKIFYVRAKYPRFSHYRGFRVGENYPVSPKFSAFSFFAARNLSRLFAGT
jgi:hypothetical protein